MFFERHNFVSAWKHFTYHFFLDVDHFEGYEDETCLYGGIGFNPQALSIGGKYGKT